MKIALLFLLIGTIVSLAANRAGPRDKGTKTNVRSA